MYPDRGVLGSSLLEGFPRPAKVSNRGGCLRHGELPKGNSCRGIQNRGDRIRTCDLLVPNQALCQAELRPVAMGNCTPRQGNGRNLTAEPERNSALAGKEAPVLKWRG